MDGSYDHVSIRERRQQSWHARRAELDERTARMTERSRIAIARSRALLARTQRQFDGRAQAPPDQDLSNLTAGGRFSLEHQPDRCPRVNRGALTWRGWGQCPNLGSMVR